MYIENVGKIYHAWLEKQADEYYDMVEVMEFCNGNGNALGCTKCIYSIPTLYLVCETRMKLMRRLK